MTKLILTLFLLIITTGIYSQKIEPFKEQVDGKLKKWGIRKKTSKKILIEPKYKWILNYNDSLISVQDFNDNYAIVDTCDRIIVPFAANETYVEQYDSLHLGKILEYTSAWNTLYYINNNRECIPYEYYPCPYWKTQVQDSVPPYINYLHKALYYNSRDHDLAVAYCDSAIYFNPANAFVYLQKAKIMLYDGFPHRKKLIQPELKNIDDLLTKAVLFENRALYRYRNDIFRYNFYKNDLKDRSKIAAIQKKYKGQNFITTYNGWFGIAGFNYERSLISHEIGLSRGFLINGARFQLKNCIQDGFMLIGTTWIKDYYKKLDGYKLYFLSFIKPLNFGLFPILYTNYQKEHFVLRPEIGIGISYFTLTAGYNFTISKNRFENIDCLGFNLRCYIPVKTSKSHGIY